MPEIERGQEAEAVYPMNLLTNREAVLEAMSTIEAMDYDGSVDEDRKDLFRLQQTKSLERSRENNPSFDYQLAGALDQIKNIMADYEDSDELPDYYKRAAVATIYGFGGGNRWFVRADGGVDFSAGHCSSDKIIKAAEDLGFRIQR